MAVEIGKIQTVVGTGEGGYAGDGGPAIQALIGEAYGCAFDTAGNLYISDGRNHTIRRIDKDSGMITTVAGCGRQGYSGDGGPATEATLNNLYSLQVDTTDRNLKRPFLPAPPGATPQPRQRLGRLAGRQQVAEALVAGCDVGALGAAPDSSARRVWYVHFFRCSPALVVTRSPLLHDFFAGTITTDKASRVPS